MSPLIPNASTGASIRLLPLYLGRLRVGAASKLALLIVASCARARAPCQLRLAEWARALSCSRRQAIRVLGALERARWLATYRRGAQWSNRYEPGPRLRAILERGIGPRSPPRR